MLKLQVVEMTPAGIAKAKSQSQEVARDPSVVALNSINLGAGKWYPSDIVGEGDEPLNSKESS